MHEHMFAGQNTQHYSLDQWFPTNAPEPQLLPEHLSSAPQKVKFKVTSWILFKCNRRFRYCFFFFLIWHHFMAFIHHYTFTCCSMRTSIIMNTTFYFLSISPVQLFHLSCPAGFRYCLMISYDTLSSFHFTPEFSSHAWGLFKLDYSKWAFHIKIHHFVDSS